MPNFSKLVDSFVATRAHTEALAAPLSAEDQQLQAMPSASPVKWHRAHTSWFFDTFVLAPRIGESLRPRWSVLFNSYYEAMGPRHARPERGLLSRPSTDEIGAYRKQVDEAVVELLARTDLERDHELAALVRLGVAHEQQHQELMLTDLLAAFARHPLAPVYRDLPPASRVEATGLHFVSHAGGIVRIGSDDEAPFSFDNEGPTHEVLLRPFALANRLVTVGEWRAFAEDDGYSTPSLWLSDGLDWVRENGIDSPAYLRRDGGQVSSYGLHGLRRAHDDEPVLHLSFYEADALATYLGARLPTEAEWEVMAEGLHDDAPRENLHPQPLRGQGLLGMFGVGHQWTRSSYEPYPGFRSAPGAIGEYNGKFMVNQLVLRGSSLFTPRGHSRPSYRNFWHPSTQFQASALRLARDE